MQLFARLADKLREARLDVHMHVFTRRLPFKAILSDLLVDGLQAFKNGLAISLTDNALSRKHQRMCAGSGYVIARESTIKMLRCCKRFHSPIGAVLKASAPEFLVAITRLES